MSDRKAILVAALCFVHCVAGPLLLAFAGLASLIGVSEKLEPLFLLSSITMGAATLVPAYRKKHRRLSCLSMFAGGLLCLMLRHLKWPVLPETIALGMGAGLIIGAHALNLRFSRQCECCRPAVELNPATAAADAPNSE